MNLSSFSLNTKIIVVFGVFLLIGVLLGEGRLKKVTLATFAGLVVADNFAKPIDKFLSTRHFLSLSLAAIQAILLITTIVLLSLGKMHKSEALGKSSLRGIILSILASVFIVTSTIHLLPPDIHDKILSQSTLIFLLYKLRIVWMGLTVVWLIILNIWPVPEKPK